MYATLFNTGITCYKIGNLPINFQAIKNLESYSHKQMSSKIVVDVLIKVIQRFWQLLRLVIWLKFISCFHWSCNLMISFITMCFKKTLNIELYTNIFCKLPQRKEGRFIYILGTSNSSLFTFWPSQLASSSRSNWRDIWTSNSNGTCTDKWSSP